MRNYLARLALPRKSTESDIYDAIVKAKRDTSDIQTVLDAEKIMSDKVKLIYYERTHLQYEAISAAIDCLKAPGALDSQHWSERVVEFDDHWSDDYLSQSL